MPAPCPGDPDYPADELPLTQENFEAEIERIRARRAPMLAELEHALANPERWTEALHAMNPDMDKASDDDTKDAE